MIRFLPLILKNVFRKKTRSILTLMAIALPIFVITFLMVILRSFDEDPSRGHGQFRLVVRHKISLASTLPESFYEKLKNIPGVQHVNILNWFGGLYVDASPKNFFARFATDPENFFEVFDEINISRGTIQEWKSTRNGLLAAEALMKKHNWQMGQTIVLKGDIYPVDLELKIVGTFKAPQEDAVFFHKKYIDEALPMRAGEISTFWLKMGSPADVDRIAPIVAAMFENTPYPAIAESEKAFQNSFLSMLGNVKFLVGSLSSVMALVILLIAANTMGMSARERVTEIAVLRTLGFQKPTILTLILTEGFFLSLLGGLLGILFCAGLLPIIKKIFLDVPGPLAGYAPFMRLFPDVLIKTSFITIFVGLTSGLIPAIRSSQRPITEGLRNVG